MGWNGMHGSYELHCDLDGQGHALFPVTDYVGVDIKITFLQPETYEISCFK